MKMWWCERSRSLKDEEEAPVAHSAACSSYFLLYFGLFIFFISHLFFSVLQILAQRTLIPISVLWVNLLFFFLSHPLFVSFKSTLSEICVFVLLDVHWDTLRDRQDKVHCSQFTHLPSIHPFIPKVRVHYRHEVDAQFIIVLIGAELT